MPQEMALGMLLANLAAMVPAIYFAGWLCDRPGMPRIVLALVVYVLLAAISVPMFFWFKTSWAACWGLQLVTMLLLSMVLGESAWVGGGGEATLAGHVHPHSHSRIHTHKQRNPLDHHPTATRHRPPGVLPVTMSSLYPPLERTTGFNFAHNCAMSLMGGLAPTVVTVRPLPALACCVGVGRLGLRFRPHTIMWLLPAIHQTRLNHQTNPTNPTDPNQPRPSAP
jgi:hypothetical protein